MTVHGRFGCLALTLLVAAACTKAPPGAPTTADATAAAATATPARAATSAVSTALAGQSFAALPDRGELVAYAPTDVRHDGAYTWHRAKLSEAYALRAIADGHLRVTTPSGQLLDIQYDDHVEHDSGDWTWVGHAAGHPEQQTILTFGPHAAFGSIAQPDGLPLRLTVRDGASWIVETDPDKVAALHNAATDPKRPDFHVPPKTHPGRESGMQISAAPAMVSATATASSTATVDVLIGYSPGFAADHGGASGAVTRLNYLVDVANVAYTNSGIGAKVRLVHAMQVTYTDSSSNDSTLEKLTGYNSTSNTQTTPDPAFNGLRAAREQYGADLVSMVRSYRDPEHDGCGIAWLIGGGQSGVSTSDSYFGYSVVSDGSDAGTDGHTYYCLDETLAHEMGHNMGAAHDVETAKGDDGTLDSGDYGAYSYSFGYKSSAAVSGGSSGFYTIMAYGDSGQKIFRIFSDPRSTFCAGHACGNASTADNARTLSQTIPTIAQFRATVVAGGGGGVRSDFNGDGVADVLWNADTGANTIWRSADRSAAQAVSSLRDVRWREAGIGDFDGDGVSDILWHNAATGGSVIWRSAKSSAPLAVASVSSSNWVIAGVADFNGDGRADILWRNRGSGANSIWLSGNNATAQAVTGVTDQHWIVAGVGDFSGDGEDDIFWRNTVTGANTIWKSGRSGTRVAVRSVTDLHWTLAVTGDFNGDGRADVFWRNGSTGANAIWLGGNAATPRSVNSVTDTAWRAVAAADYDGNGKADVFWRNGASGSNVIWRAAVKSDSQWVASVASQSWQVGN